MLFIWRLCLGLWAAARRAAARPADHGHLTGFARQHVAAGAVFLFAGVCGALAAVCGRYRPAAGAWRGAVFQKLRAQTKGSIVVISHQERILEIADEIIVLSDGKVVRQGPRDEILSGLVCGGGRCAFCTKEAGCHE